jgi:hypothetical protein
MTASYESFILQLDCLVSHCARSSASCSPRSTWSAGWKLSQKSSGVTRDWHMLATISHRWRSRPFPRSCARTLPRCSEAISDCFRNMDPARPCGQGRLGRCVASNRTIASADERRRRIRGRAPNFRPPDIGRCWVSGLSVERWLTGMGPHALPQKLRRFAFAL